MGQSGEVLRDGGRQSDTSLLEIFPALRIVPYSSVQHCAVVHCTPACAAHNADVGHWRYFFNHNFALAFGLW